jgi:hypothetical protein
MSGYLASLGATQICVFGVVFVIGFAGLVMPFVRYLVTGWSAKRADILDGLDADARVAYFTMFIRVEPVPDRAAALTGFDDFYRRWYGRWHFLGPGLLYAAAAAVVCGALATCGLMLLAVLPPLPAGRIPTTALAALAGAYLWVANDLVSRARRLDFAPADLQWATLRLVIAIPMGYAFGRIASPLTAADLVPVIAFGLGAFPLDALLARLARATDKLLGQTLQSNAGRNDIGHLQGVNAPIIERLADEDITTVTQLAYCDPVQIAMRSALTFVFVTDLMNQALAWIYFEKQLAVLRALGLRGACEIKDFIDAYDGVGDTPATDAMHAKAAMPSIAAKVGQTEDTVQIAFRQIAGDPYTLFLNQVWTSPFDATQSDATPVATKPVH